MNSSSQTPTFPASPSTRSAFAVVMTGETAKYGNIILKKGVTPLC